MASKKKESRVGGWREPIITIDNKAFVLIIEGDYLTKCSKAVYVCIWPGGYSLFRKKFTCICSFHAKFDSFSKKLFKLEVSRHSEDSKLVRKVYIVKKNTLRRHY